MGLGTSLFRLFHGSTMRRFAGIPGRLRSSRSGRCSTSWGRPTAPVDGVARYAREYGGVTLIWLLGRPALVLNDPGLIGEVLDTRAADFYKNSPRNALRPVLTDDEPFIENGPEWAFNPGEPSLPHEATGRLAGRPGGSGGEGHSHWVRRLIDQGVSAPVDFTEVIQRLSFDVFAMWFRGRVLDDQAYGWFLRMARTGDRRMELDLRFPGCRRLARGFPGPAIVVWARRTSTKRPGMTGAAQRGDLLRIWLRHGSNSKPAAFRHAMANIFYGGVFSVTSVLVTSLYLLAHDPAAEDRLREEVRDLMERKRDFDRTSLEGCVYLDAVLRESMRYYPPVPLYFRNVMPDRAIEFAGHTIPADTLIFVTNWFLHASRRTGRTPGGSIPAGGWAGARSRDPLGSGYFFPFGRGPRTCLGMSFALFFMKLALATIMAESRVELDRSLSYVQDFFFGVMMPKGLKVISVPGSSRTSWRGGPRCPREAADERRHLP